MAEPPPPGALNLDELGFGGAQPSSPSGRSTSVRTSGRGRGAPPGQGPSRPLVALGVVVVLALVFAGSYFLSGRLQLDDGEGPAEAPPAEDVVATDLPPGTVLIDAAPWASIASIRDADGEDVTVIGARYTPKRMELAPGVYTVVLEHPPTSGSQQATLEVESGGEQSIRVNFDIDVEEFFRRAVW